jgi:hypothetical protein
MKYDINIEFINGDAIYLISWFRKEKLVEIQNLQRFMIRVGPLSLS